MRTKPRENLMSLNISVVIPTYNRCALIGESIASAWHQDIAPHEIIVVDDGSTDATAQVVEAACAPVRYLRQDNAGKSAALNRGIEAARGDLLLVLDDDDILPAGALAAHVAALEGNPDAAISYGRFTRFRGPGEEAHLSRDIEPMPDQDGRRFLVRLLERCFLPNPAWMVRREAQLLAGPYRSDLPRGQDYDMILRIARENRAVSANAVTLYQRKHISERRTREGLSRTENTVGGWIEAEKSIFAKIDETWDDSDFAPYDDVESGDEARRLAALQRGVVMFMRKLYDRSERHFRRYALMPGADRPGARELVVAGSLMGCRYGIEEILDGREDISWLRQVGLPDALRPALACQLPWRLRELAQGGRLRDAGQLLAIGSRTFGAKALAHAAAARVSRALAR